MIRGSAGALAMLLGACAQTGAQTVNEWHPAVAREAEPTLQRSSGYVLTEPGLYDFQWQKQQFQTMAVPVVEYTEPALQIATDGVVVERFAFGGAMEGPHISSVYPFSGLGRRREHDRIRGVIRGLRSMDIGEDALTIGPWAMLRLEHAYLRGRYQPGQPYDGDMPGMDKGIQNDGGSLFTGPGVVLENFVRAYRGKASSVAVLDGVRFVACHNPVRGDGMANPREDWPFDRGQPGLCLIVVRNCVFTDNYNPFRAGPGCVILVDRASVRFEGTRGPMVIEEGDGRVIFTRQIGREWRRFARRLDEPAMAFWQDGADAGAGTGMRQSLFRRGR